MYGSDICVIWPLVCPSQFGNERRRLGPYELKEDAARAYDQVAGILGRSDLNFPNSDTLEIKGPRSDGADKAVAAAVEAARAFVATGGKRSGGNTSNQTSTYIGVRKVKRSNTNPWQSKLHVSSKTCGVHLINRHVSTHACAHVCAPKCARTYARERLSAHTHTHTRPPIVQPQALRPWMLRS